MRKDFFYTPNHIPVEKRRQNVCFSIALLAYGSYGIWVNDLYLPGKRGRGLHLHDIPAWVMYGSIVCACLVMLSVVIDHYDTRNNERSYKFFSDLFTYLGFFFFILSIAMAVLN